MSSNEPRNRNTEASVYLTNEVDGRARRQTNKPIETRSLSPTSNLNTNENRSPTRRNRRDINRAGQDGDPLLTEADSEVFNPQLPPIVGPEMDDDKPDDNVPYTPEARPGVDDGFFPPNTPRQRGNGNPNGKPDIEMGTRNGDDENLDKGNFPSNNLPQPGQIGPGRRPSRPPSEFPYAPGFGPNVMTETGVPGRVIPDVNEYQQKKNLAQGMMDLALLSANANQLRYVVESYQRHPYYYFSVVFISLSLILQVAVGIGLIWNSRYNVKNEDDICKADRINNYTIIGIFLITVVNVFVSAFGVAPPAAT